MLLAAIMLFSAGCGKKAKEAANLPQTTQAQVTESAAETKEQTSRTKEQTEEEVIPVPEVPGNIDASDPSRVSAVVDSSFQAAPSAQAQDGYEPRDEAVYATQKVNIREAASTDSAKVGSLEAGESIHRTGYTAGWSQVEYNGTTCYIASEYLSDQAPEPVNAQVQAPSRSELWSGDLNTLSTNVFSGIASYDDRDARNVPNGCYYLNKLYGKYNALFLEDTSKNVIYLTMDEGYEAGFTPQILQTLREKNVKATFFVTKEFYDSNPEYIQQMIDDGHTVGNHTCNHKNMPTLSLEEQTNEIMVLHNIIKEQFGYEMKLFRFPEGSTSEQSLGLVESLGYKSVFWSFHYLDYNSDAQKDPAETLQLCMDSIHPGAIYLLHAKSATNTQILGDWIDAVRAAGYEFGGGLPTD